MSIETVEFEGPAVLKCDHCGTFLEFSSFNRAVKFKKIQKEKPGGWRSFKEEGEWRDACGNCVKAFTKGEVG